MASLEEALANNQVFVIDAENRTIEVPESELLFGVTGDKDSERKYFQCPMIVGDNVDLSVHQIYVSYAFADTQNSIPSVSDGLYHCDDVAVDGDNITFSWRLSGNVFTKPGFIGFKILAKYSEGEVTTLRWNTTPAYGLVLQTIPDGETIAEQYPDVINQILTRLDGLDGGVTGDTISLPSGGTMGQYLMKQSDVDGDAIWSDVDHHITYVESMATDGTRVNFRDLDSGHYIIYGYFEPYPNSNTTISADNSLIHVYRAEAGSYIICLDPLNAKVVFFEIMADESNEKGFIYTRENISLLDLQSKPKATTIDLPASGWVAVNGSTTLYSQTVTVSQVTANSQVELRPSPEQIQELLIAEISMTTANESGNVTVFAIGAAPTSDYSMQIIISEVNVV